MQTPVMQTRIQAKHADRQVKRVSAQELCESRGGLCGVPVPNRPYGLSQRKAPLEGDELPDSVRTEWRVSKA